MNVQEEVYHLLLDGYNQRASDIYLLPYLTHYRVSIRHHNHLETYKTFSQELGEKILIHLKYLADMDVAEKRRIQAGSVTYPLSDKENIRLRFSTIANYQNRESMVIRFLYSATTKQASLTFFPNDFQQLRQHIHQKGLFLFSGPTGSGKTTTMYQLANYFAEKEKQVITIEDPVEIEHPDFLQLQINPAIDATYERLVQVCLRHRPDVLIVGEIRDEQTARAVVRGALTGHTILSTVHARSISGVWMRLLELGVSSEELKQCLKGIFYQRLLPYRCPYCNGTCHRYCPYPKEGVLYDQFFLEEGDFQDESIKVTNNWNTKLKKAWSLGYITTNTYIEYKY